MYLAKTVPGSSNRLLGYLSIILRETPGQAYANPLELNGKFVVRLNVKIVKVILSMLPPPCRSIFPVDMRAGIRWTWLVLTGSTKTCDATCFGHDGLQRVPTRALRPIGEDFGFSSQGMIGNSKMPKKNGNCGEIVV